MNQPRGEEFPIVLVPHQSHTLTRLSKGRKSRFRNGLEELVRGVWKAEPSQTPEKQGDAELLTGAPGAAPEIRSRLATACALCRGSCCRGGGEHAYLRPETIDRYRQAHPEATVEQIVQAYCDALPAQSISDSCVYHGACGCELPHELRSAICLRYFCPPLEAYRKALMESPADRVFLASEENGQIRSAAFVDADSVRLVPKGVVARSQPVDDPPADDRL